MTSLTQPCADFGELVQDVQECTDAGEGLEQLSSKGLAALLFVRHLGFDMFDATERGKVDTAAARHAFDEKTLVLQNILYETGYYQKEIQEAADYKSNFSDSDLELMVVEEFQQHASAEFTAGLDSSSPDYEHHLTLRRLDHELHARKQARKKLSENKARRDALQTNLGQKRKAQAELRRHIGQINDSTQNVRQLFDLADVTSCQQDELAQLLPLPLYLIFSQSTAILDTLSTAVEAKVIGSQELAGKQLAKAPSQPAHKRQKRAASVAENELYQAFPLTVKLHLTQLSLDITFAYLPSLGLITAEAGDLTSNELLATLFDGDTGVDTPLEAYKYMGEEGFEFDSAATARPYRWAQWLAGLDFLPQLPAGLHFQGAITEEALQSALACYRRERRATHILATLVRRAEDSSELGQQIKELVAKRLPLRFPNRLFQQPPAGLIQNWQHFTGKGAPSRPPSAASAPPAPAPAAAAPTGGAKGPSHASTADKPDDPEEGEEGELEDAPEAPQNLTPLAHDAVAHGAEAMEVDPDAAEQDGDAQSSGQAPVPLWAPATNGSLVWAQPLPDAPSKLFKIVLRSQHGWQLDGHITVHSGYPAVPPQVSASGIKESFNPARPVGGSRREMPPQIVSAVLQEGNARLLSKLHETERSQTLSYQVCQLLESLSQLNEADSKVMTKKSQPGGKESRGILDPPGPK